MLPGRSIKREAATDGLRVIQIIQSDLRVAAMVRSYRQLSRVESAFRCLNGVDLPVTLIHQRVEQRGRAIAVRAGALRGTAPARLLGPVAD